MIHRKKNYQLYKDATCHNLRVCDFTDVAAFSSLFFLALQYCIFLCIFFLLWIFLWLFKFFTRFFFTVVLFFFMATFLPESCFSWQFLWPFLPSSSWCFFFLHSVELLSLPIGSSYGTLLGHLLPSFLFVIIVVFVLIDTWLGSFFF